MIDSETKCLYIKKTLESHLSIPDIGKRSGKQMYTYARYLYYALCTRLANSTYDVCGNCLNKTRPFDHSTVYHGLKEFDKHQHQRHFLQYSLAYDFMVEKCKLYFDFLKEEYDLESQQIEHIEIEKFYRLRLIRIIDKSKSLIDSRDEEIKFLKSKLNRIKGIEVFKPKTVRKPYAK